MKQHRSSSAPLFGRKCCNVRAGVCVQCKCHPYNGVAYLAVAVLNRSLLFQLARPILSFSCGRISRTVSGRVQRFSATGGSYVSSLDRLQLCSEND